jgi:23S rRNA pseudouridine1911/1915/1917 synthase
VTIIVPAEADGERLDRFLAAALDGISRARIQKHIEAGAVTIGGALPKRASATPVHEGEVVVYRPPPPQILDIVPEDIPLPILFEDAHLMVIDKPNGMVVHPAAGHRAGTLLNAVLHHLEREATTEARPLIVHRLDRGTTGAIVVAKNESMQEALSALFQARKVEKIYLALAIGVPEPRDGTIDTHYGRHPTDRKRFSGRVARGKRAITHYAVKEIFGARNAALIEVHLETGRTHQIRVHLAEHGNPLVGDAAYGGKRAERFDLDIARPALHAHRIAFDHPATGARVDVTAPVPPDFAALVSRLRA